MRKALSLLLIALMASGYLMGQTSGNKVIDLILTAYQPKNLTTEPVTDQQTDLILKCGIRSPSNGNRQPWKFTVIRDEASMKNIVEDAVSGNVLIVVSGLAPVPGKSSSDLDCGLAAQTMAIAAEGLGLGVRMYGSAARKVNLSRDVYQIPEGYNAFIVLRIGNMDNSVDAVSSASVRKTPEEVINYKK